MSVSRTVQSDLLLVLVTLLAAAGWMFSKEALVGLTPLLFIGVRFFSAGLILGLVGGRSLKALSIGDWHRALLTGLAMATAMSFWIMGLSLATNLGIGAFIASLGVVLTPLMARLLFGVRTAPTTWVAVGTALVGLALLRLEGGFSLSASDGFFLAAAVAFSVHFNLNSRFAARIPALPLTAIQLGVTGLASLTLFSFLEPAPVWPGWSILGWLTASILLGTCLRFFFQVKAQGMAQVSHAAVIMTLEPVWTALLGSLWFAERMSPLQLLGCCIIFGALLISRWRLLFRRPIDGQR
ncbi:permease [Saccharospirillum salsuginis]|uniref:Permease n=2 Tax=Saccharospirillum salsuginis TaxID=418750 RepID=A0A918K9R4_9GAMM|nr:permease [Saccharospirillum salsuginis]